MDNARSGGHRTTGALESLPCVDVVSAVELRGGCQQGLRAHPFAASMDAALCNVWGHSTELAIALDPGGSRNIISYHPEAV